MTANNTITNDGDRGVPSVHGKQKSAPKGAKAAVGLVILFVVLLTALFGYRAYVRLVKSDDGKQHLAQMRTTGTSSLNNTDYIAPPPKENEHFRTGGDNRPAYVPPPRPIQVEPQTPAGRPGDRIRTEQGSKEKEKNPLDELNAKKYASSLSKRGGASTSPAADGSGGAAGGGPREASDSNIGSMLTPTTFASVKASKLAHRDYLMPQGAMIDCGMDTKIDTTVPGMVSCTVSQNVYSENGRTLLVERGSKFTGEYRSSLRQGQARIFVLWNRIRTPNGVVVNIASPGTDPLGGSGLTGYVDTHFWARFGGAIMLSLIQDSIKTLGNIIADNRGSNNNINYSNTETAGEKMAVEALRNSINIPPTLYKNQGERISIFVARDVSFEPVYRLSADQQQTEFFLE
jgi:type IV secretion system protein VirB10